MSRTVLVLSATGTTGRETVRALVAAGATVRAATRDPAQASFGPGVTPVAFSLDDQSTWAPALTGVDALYFCLAPFREDEVAVGTALLAAAKAAGVTRIVKLSAMGVEHAPESDHRQLERVIEASGFEWIHLRPTFFFENFVNFYGGSIKGDGGIYLPAGKGRTPFVAAADIGDVAAQALLGTRSGEAWVLTGSELLDHDQVAAILTGALGRPIHYVDIPREAHIEGMKGYGMPPLAVTVMSGLYDMVRVDAMAHVSPTVGEVLGRPPLRFGEWAQTHAAAWT